MTLFLWGDEGLRLVLHEKRLFNLLSYELNYRGILSIGSLNPSRIMLSLRLVFLTR